MMNNIQTSFGLHKVQVGSVTVYTVKYRFSNRYLQKYQIPKGIMVYSKGEHTTLFVESINEEFVVGVHTDLMRIAKAIAEDRLSERYGHIRDAAPYAATYVLSLEDDMPW
jgi:hypothetical protein